MSEKLRVLDLFSGIGGFSLGLERTGMMETVAFCEFEDYATRVLNKHWPNVPVIDDVRNLNGEDFRGSVEVICGGFPCQDISIAGKNKGIRGERSGLWSEYKRIIKEAQPKYAIIENVSALLSRGLHVVLSDLAEIGYDATWTMLDTKYFGLPQRRRRVFIIAVRDGIPPDADIFQFGERDSDEHRSAMESVKKGFEWDFTKSNRNGHPFAFFTRQRSNEFAEVGLSSALLKRDYKDFSDLVFSGGFLRRVIPEERMLLQGFPRDWLDDCELTKIQRFICAGMSTNVVEWVGERLLEYDANV